MKREVVGSMSEWAGVLGDFFRQIKDGSITLPQVTAFAEHKNPFPEVNLSEWQSFYQGFGIQTDFSDLRIPQKQRGFDRLLVIAQGISPQGLYDKCGELFSVWKWTSDNLDEIVESERTSKDGAYAVWVRDRVEADEELKNLSVEKLKEKDIPGITLEERFVYELKYFKETGNHLDPINVSLCASSRYSGGLVPDCCWYDGEFYVSYCNPRDAYPDLRARAVVS